MKITVVNLFRFFICGVFTLQIMGCGTLMYPERKGQKGGRIDTGVAILDGVGLLLFIIPGIIAFAIDFNNGTIYLPGTFRTSLNIENIKEIKFDPQHSSMASIEKIIKDQTGCEVKLDNDSYKIAQLKSVNDMLAQLAHADAVIKNDRIALL